MACTCNAMNPATSLYTRRLSVPLSITLERKQWEPPIQCLRFFRRPLQAQANVEVHDVNPDNAAEKRQEHSENNNGGKPLGFFPKKNQVLELVCESLAFQGKAVCKAIHSNFVLLCDRALPGERFIGRVTRPARRGSLAQVKKIKTISIHDDSVKAPCEYAGYCGGCRMQDLAYHAQIKAKEQQVRDLIVNIGKFPETKPGSAQYIKPILPCDLQFHYRNKMEFSFGTNSWVPSDVASKPEGQDTFKSSLGLHVPGFFDKIVPIRSCFLQHEIANKVLEIVQECWQNSSSDLSAYNTHSHTGFLRHLVLRTGSDHKRKPQLMVNFVTSDYKPDLLQPIVQKIIKTVPEVVSIINNVNTSLGNRAVGQSEYLLHGSSIITEFLGGLTFEISANSFFQVNIHQTEKLYALIEEAAELRGDASEIVLDLFCGTGTIGLSLAKRVKHVYGYEVVPQAVADARRNAERNDIKNASFIQGDLNKIVTGFINEFPFPDIVITDPNRPGMHEDLICALLKLRASRIIYVSCNPATCARDLDYLCHGLPKSGSPGAYQLKSVQPVDMFPHTPHIECVCLLELNHP